MNTRSLANLMSSPRPDSQPVAITQANIVTWSQFNHDVSQLTEQLILSKHLRWAICFEDSYYFAVAFMAAAHARRHIILPGNHQPAALAELSTHFDAILHDGVFQHNFDKAALKLPVSDTEEITNFTHFAPLPLCDIRLTLFTSGSSGTPTAIEKTLDLLDAEITQLDATWGELLSNSTIASTVSHQHIYGLLFRVLWPLCAGLLFERFDLIYPEQVMAHAGQNTTLISSPALLKRLTDDQATTSYRAIFSSGGPLPPSAAQQSLHLFEQLPFEVFGSTETGGIGYRQQQETTTPWQLFPSIDMALNAEGCLRLRSPFIDPDNWYQTSDQCEPLGADQFMLKGRADRVVKIEEKRISLTEVERRLCQLEWIEEAAVFPQEETNRLILAAVITLTKQGKATLSDMGKGKFWLKLRQELRLWLEPIGIPRRYRAVDEIPLNTQGKRLIRDLELLFKQESKEI
ncbi:AMP-fatty acid ligase [Photobacterium lipolyticum]|uniref:AMP-fatty acid ligase n=2 Tax=Photobacterium lipolyticum TaxID=266810 RepID=A0A2T3N3L6_9GAMM|nr:AMP-fatty acid ligase [Photobacterium lipolyticum]